MAQAALEQVSAPSFCLLVIKVSAMHLKDHPVWVVLFLAGAAAGCGDAPSERPTAVVQQVADEVWQRMLEDDPALRLREGLKVDQLPDLSLEKAQHDAELARSDLERLEPLDPQELQLQDRITRDILIWRAQLIVEGLDHYWLNSPITPYNSPLNGIHQVLRDFPFQDEGDLRRYLGLLDGYSKMVARIEEIVRQQDLSGIRVPQVELDLAIPLLRSFIRPAAESLFAVDPQRLSELQQADLDSFHRQVEEAVSTFIMPALEKLSSFLEGEYRKNAPQQVGLWQYPGGRDCYRYLVRYHTTLDLTPQQVHQMGLEEVARIESEQATIRQELGFEGSREEFHRFLKTDPQFFPQSPQEVEDRLKGYGQRMAQQVERLFGNIPEAPWDVRRLDPLLEASMTFGYYQVPTPREPHGIYFYNGSDLDQRSWISFESLAYHELLPGHHFQISLQTGNQSLHPVRREFFATAFVEGWAEYAASLGFEAGLYQDPYDRYGRLAAELFLAVRLVVDTGMNALQWTREQASQYMRERLLESEQQISTETLRYSVDIPGQALGYKVGSIRFRQLRERTRQAQGEAFDVRRFHDALIGSGTMPLSVLEKHLESLLQ